MVLKRSSPLSIVTFSIFYCKCQIHISHLSKGTYFQIWIWEFHNKHLLGKKSWNIRKMERQQKVMFCTLNYEKCLIHRIFYMPISVFYDYLLPTDGYHNWDTPAYQFSSVQSLSRVRLFVTPWIAARQASLSITNSRSSLRLTSSESVMPSSHLILGRPLLLPSPIPPSIRVFSNESTLLMRWPKYWSFSFTIIPSKEIPGLITFRMDWLDQLYFD